MARKRLIGQALTFAFILAIQADHGQAALPRFEQPGWTALTAEQRTILAPLAEDWAGMDAFRRKKWIGIAQRYPDMTPAEQASMQRNMREWALLAPEERKAIREKYKTLKKVTPEQRQNVKLKWEEYQSLTQEERDHLRAKAPVRPPPPKTLAKPPAKVPLAHPGSPLLASPAATLPKSPLSPLKQPQSLLVPEAPTLTVAPGPATAAPTRD